MLKVRDLQIRFPHPDGAHPDGDRIPLCGWNLDMKAGEILGLAGKSGCGKTVFCSSLLGILEPPGRIEKGRLCFTPPAKEGSTGGIGETPIDLRTLTEKGWRYIRGRHIGMVFQDPRSALNPAYKIQNQFFAAIRAHNRSLTKREMEEQSAEFLAAMAFPDPRRILESYPFELSGGMCQRVVTALALIHRPALLIADEPTTALDVITESRIIRLFSRIREERGTGILLVSHDERILRLAADRVVRMP
jgi:ABC-type dipeptide/oligopeptide/nickel transport system ATPase component